MNKQLDIFDEGLCTDSCYRIKESGRSVILKYRIEGQKWMAERYDRKFMEERYIEVHEDQLQHLWTSALKYKGAI